MRLTEGKGVDQVKRNVFEARAMAHKDRALGGRGSALRAERVIQPYT